MGNVKEVQAKRLCRWHTGIDPMYRLFKVYVFVGFMALITAMVLCVKSQDSLLSVSVSVGSMSYFRLLDLRVEESRVLRHLKPPV